jgi:hypothetical protein
MPGAEPVSTLSGPTRRGRVSFGEAARGSRVVRVALSAVVVAAPAVLTCVLLAVLFDATLLDYFPKVSDEIAYYQQVATFVRAGFNGGYFTDNELPAPFAATHFGPHGPAFAVIYGSFGWIVGWTLQSGPIFNLGALAVATTVFIWTTRPSLVQIGVIGAVISTSWWVTLMASITMQESLNHAFLVVVAAFVARLLNPDTGQRGLLLFAALTTLAVASLLRPTNWIVAVPLVFVALIRRPVLAAMAGLATGIGFPILWLVWRFISAPVPGRPLDFDGMTRAGVVARLSSHFFTQMSSNIASIFDIGAFVTEPFFQYVVYETMGVALVSAVLAAAAVRRAVAGQRGGHAVELREAVNFRVDVMNATVLSVVIVAFLGFYYDIEASVSRVMVPFLLLSQLVLAATRCRPWLLASTILASLLVAPSFVTVYRAWRADLFLYDRVRFESFRSQVSPLIVYRAEDGPWCNTLLTMSYDREIVGVPAGIGLSVARVDGSRGPVKSKYLLLTGEGLRSYASRTRLEHLQTTVLGELFVNRDASCD